MPSRLLTVPLVAAFAFALSGCTACKVESRTIPVESKACMGHGGVERTVPIKSADGVAREFLLICKDGAAVKL